MITINRRRFLSAVCTTLPLGAAITACMANNFITRDTRNRKENLGRFFFTSQGKTAMMNSDGSGLRFFEFKVPNQATWQPCGFFSDGHRVLFLSMEPRLDGPGKPFDEYYHKTPTHLWTYDLDKDELKEIATKDRLSVFYIPQLLLSDERILVQVVRNKVGQIFSMNLDGSDAKEFTRAGEGFPYGLSLSPDKKRIAFHLAGSSGYQVWTCDSDGGNRKLVAGSPDHLYFCPLWSPDGEWLMFQDCQHKNDPGHDWSDIYLCRPDGSEQRLLTQGQSLWFAAAYGPSGNHGGGSNTPSWTHDGKILCSHRLPGTKGPWEYQKDRPDTDHFNRDFKPELSHGGTEICRIDPRSGSITRITHSEPPVWDFRQSESPDGKQIVFCRAKTGESPAIWVADSNGKNQRLLTKGINDKGADHPGWVPKIAKV